MVTGELPFRSNGPLDAWMRKVNNEIEAPRTLVPELSERVDWAIRRAMSPNPLHRPENCREFISDLTGHGTQRLSDTEPTLEGPDLWYVVYHDAAGVRHNVKATTASIRRSLEDAALGDVGAIRVTPRPDQPYEGLEHFAEFRDLAQALRSATTLAPADTIAEPAAQPRPVEQSGPHIRLAPTRRSGADEVWKWLALVSIALCAGTAGYYYMPLLLRWRWL
jgi:hypothetical protein